MNKKRWKPYDNQALRFVDSTPHIENQLPGYNGVKFSLLPMYVLASSTGVRLHYNFDHYIVFTTI